MSTSIQWVPLDRLTAWPGNPRKRIDEGALRELEESIAAKGLLQNLVGRPGPDDAGPIEIVSGGRRLAALKRLEAKGRLGPFHPVPVNLRDLDDRDALRLATAENVVRSEMGPLEEADAFARLVELGDMPESIAELTGIGERTIRRRLALHHRLGTQARAALEEGRINLGQAAALTLGEKEAQTGLVEAALRQPDAWPPARIRGEFVGRLPCLDDARFDPARYDGPLLRDLFHDRSWAQDRARFMALQREAANAMLDQLTRVWAWGEIFDGRPYTPWEFARDHSPEEGAGCVVHLRADGKIDVHTGLVRHRPEPAAPASTPVSRAGPPPASAGAGSQRKTAASPAPGSADPATLPFGGLSEAHLDWARQDRMTRLRRALAAEPRLAVAVLLASLLGADLVGGIEPVHAAVDRGLRPEIDRALSSCTTEPAPWPVADPLPERRWRGLVAAFAAAEPHEQSGLLAAVAAAAFWPWEDDEGDPVFVVELASRLGVAPYRLDDAYLRRLDRASLARVAVQSGAIDPAAPLPADRDALIDEILLSPTLDPDWQPPELRFGSAAALAAALAENADG